ncbi:MAG: gliding motility-associated C-terminal domain-containing protein [Flavobacteriales bacterium]
MEVTDANLCKVTDAIAVDFVSSSKINLGNDTTFCAGVNNILDAGVGYASYSWTGAKTGSAQTLLADVSGTYYVSASGACSSKDTVVITIQPKPTVNLGADISTCVTSVILHAQPAHAAYLWNDGSTDSTLVAAASGLFWVQVSNALNCTARDSVQVNLGASSSVNLGLDASVCERTTKTLDAGGGFTSYAWSGAKTGSSQTIIADVAGTYYVEANNGACVAKDTFVLTVDQNPKPLLGNDVTLCKGSSVTFNAGTFASYLWSDASMAITLTTNVSGSYWVEVTDANSCKGRDTAAFNTQNTIALNLGADKIMCSGVFPLLDAGNGFTTYAWSGVKSCSSQQITADIAGDYIVKVTSGLCESIDTIKIDFYAPPSVDLGADKDVCAGSTTTLDAGIFNSYLWSTGETIQTVSKSAGTYWVKVADANSCVAYDTVVVSTVPLPQVNIGSDILACVGDVKTIQDNVAQAGLTYSWNDGSTSSSLQIRQSGTYTLTVSDANNCNNSDELNATFNSAPQIDLLAGADTALLCEGDIQILDASTSGFGLSYVWYPSKETTAMIGVKKTGDYCVTVSNGSCSASDTVHVEMVTLPQSVLNDTLNANSATYCFAEEMAGVDISAASSDGKPYQYLWSTGATTPTINVTQEGTYSVTVSMANCEVKDNLKLIDYCATTMYLPSAFSPNGDGVNETFFARGNYLDDYKILIFNRWGELIYSINSFSDSWDGTYAGVKVEQDVYVYKVLYTQHEPSGLDSKKEMIGRVVVLR